MKYPSTILNLIECFKKLPGIGEKTAERLALSVLDIDSETIDIFSNSLKDSNRNNKILCVVEEPKNVILFEKLNIFDGYYHVLDGLISPIDGINPEDLNISSLVDRVKQEKIEEVILALKPSIEGETTSLYISRILEDLNVKISKIAYGIPIGAEIDYVDSLTLEMALENRMDISTNKDS